MRPDSCAKAAAIGKTRGGSSLPPTDRSIEVEAEMLQNITSGRWPVGHCIGPYRELPGVYRCTRSDLNRALYALRQRGFIVIRRGSPSNLIFVESQESNRDATTSETRR
jgi:DNA-binding FadR family transcriptional regulator